MAGKRFLTGIRTHVVTDLDDPILPLDAANKQYVDSRRNLHFQDGASPSVPSGVNIAERFLVYLHIGDDGNGYPIYQRHIWIPD